MSENLIKLSNNIEIPNIGYGTGITSVDFDRSLKNQLRIIKRIATGKFDEIKKSKNLKKITKSMVNYSNYNLIDTSSAYGKSEKILGSVIENNREKYFITTKLCNKAQLTSVEEIRATINQSLKKLKTDYIDLYLIHWPVTCKYLEAWKIIEEYYEKGIFKAIGVANCNIHHLEEIRKIAKINPMVNQIECHPLFTQEELRKYCNGNNIKVMAYTPTARMDERLFKTCLVNIAEKYKKSVAQIILRWHIQIGNIPIVNTYNKEHFKENMNVNSFCLTKEEIQAISSININSRLRYDPDNCNFEKL